MLKELRQESRYQCRFILRR